MQNASPIKTQIKIFGLVLSVLLAVIAVRTQKQPTVKPMRPLLAFPQEQVKAFRINHFTSSLLFKKTGDIWQVRKDANAFTDQIDKGETGSDITAPKKKGGSVAVITEFTEADAATVSRLLTTLCELQVDEPIATNANLADFKINPHSLHVIFYSDEEASTILGRLNIGKQGADLFSSFVTLGEDKNIFAVENSLTGMVNRNYEEFLPKKKTEGTAIATGTSTGTATKKKTPPKSTTKKKKR